MKPEYSPERLADRAEIHDVVYRWARGIDRRDWDMIRSVFHPDGTDHHGIYDGGVDGLIEWLKQRHLEIPQCMHLVGNILIEFTGKDTALVESYCGGFHIYADAGRDARVALLGEKIGEEKGEIYAAVLGRYVDEFERRDGDWKVLRRTTVFESMNAHIIKDAPAMGSTWMVQTRDPNDVILAKRRQYGLHN